MDHHVKMWGNGAPCEQNFKLFWKKEEGKEGKGEHRVLLHAGCCGGKLGGSQLAPGPRGLGPRSPRCSPIGEGNASGTEGGGCEVLVGTQLASHWAVEADTAHFPCKRARIHWPDSPACEDLGTNQKIWPEVHEEVRFLARCLAWAVQWCLHGSQEHVY